MNLLDENGLRKIWGRIKNVFAQKLYTVNSGLITLSSPTLAKLKEYTNTSNAFCGSVILDDGPTGYKCWYNVVWIPHQFGYGSSDGMDYGRLLLMTMTDNGSAIGETFFYVKSNKDWLGPFKYVTSADVNTYIPTAISASTNVYNDSDGNYAFNKAALNCPLGEERNSSCNTAGITGTEAWYFIKTQRHADGRVLQIAYDFFTPSNRYSRTGWGNTDWSNYKWANWAPFKSQADVNAAYQSGWQSGVTAADARALPESVNYQSGWNAGKAELINNFSSMHMTDFNIGCADKWVSVSSRRYDVDKDVLCVLVATHNTNTSSVNDTFSLTGYSNVIWQFTESGTTSVLGNRNPVWYFVAYVHVPAGSTLSASAGSNASQAGWRCNTTMFFST